MTHVKSKKESTTKELAYGGGLFLLFIPLILFAVLGIGLALIVTFVLAFAQFESSVLLVMGTVYGGLFFLLLRFLWKFSSRFRLLVGRWLGLRQENRRMAETIDTSRLALESVNESKESLLIARPDGKQESYQ